MDMTQTPRPFAPGNLTELDAMKALSKRPFLSRAEQAEGLTNEIEALIARAQQAGFAVRVETSPLGTSIVVQEARR